MKQAHQTFIIEMIKHGDKTLAYQKAYPKCIDSESARKSAERLLRHHPEVAAEIEEATTHIRHRAYAEAYRLHTEQQKVPLLSILKKREILTQLATCEMKVGRYVKDGDTYKLIFEDPRPRDIIKAIEVDTRLEEMCNRARNITDPQLSQFNIYIDGRPCDDPTAPVNPDLPPGLIMLPRTRKKLIEEQGNISEHSCLEDTHDTSPLQGDLGVQLAQEQNPTEEQGIKPEQNQEATLPTLRGTKQSGGENGDTPTGVSHSGEVDSRRTLASEKNPDEEPGIILEQTNLQHLSPEFIPPLAGGESEGLAQQYLALLEKRQLRATDLLGASLYKQDKAAEAAAPPPKIFTEEEVRELHAGADRREEEKKKPRQQPYSTFGKMYFPPERS